MYNYSLIKLAKYLGVRPEKCIEVKAEENLRSKSLRGFIVEDYPNENLKGLRCSMKPYIDQDWMENIPLYSVLGYINKQIESEK